MVFRIFVSSTVTDLKDERDAVTQAVNTLRQVPIRSELIMARTEAPLQVCTQEATNCSVYVGIFKNRYGFVPQTNNPRKLSVTELEYEAARNANKPIKVFISKSKLFRIKRRETQLTEFLKRITETNSGHLRGSYSNTEELKYLVTASLAVEIIQQYKATSTKALSSLVTLDNKLVSSEQVAEYADVGIRNYKSMVLDVIGWKKPAEEALREQGP
jgi:hypothetical protein